MKSILKDQCPQGDSHKSKMPIFIHSDVDDYGLDPFEFRFYSAVARRAGRDGEFFEGLSKTAKRCKMSLSKAREAKKFVVAAGLVELVPRKGKSDLMRLTAKENWMPSEQLDSLRKSLHQSPTKSDMGSPPIESTTPTRPHSTPLPDLDHLPPSDLDHEVTPISSSPEVNSHNNSVSGSLIDESSANLSDRPIAVQSELAHGKEAGDLGEDNNSAPLNLQQAKKLGVDIYTPALLEVAKQYPDRISGAIAYTTKQVEAGKIRDSVTGYLITAIQRNFKLDPAAAAPDINEGWGEWFQEAQRRGIVSHGAGRDPDGANRVFLTNGETSRYCDLKGMSWQMLEKRVECIPVLQ